jgi:hypothetical protein
MRQVQYKPHEDGREISSSPKALKMVETHCAEQYFNKELVLKEDHKKI